jgi:hypothetical protein
MAGGPNWEGQIGSQNVTQLELLNKRYRKVKNMFSWTAIKIFNSTI